MYKYQMSSNGNFLENKICWIWWGDLQQFMQKEHSTATPLVFKPSMGAVRTAVCNVRDEAHVSWDLFLLPF